MIEQEKLLSNPFPGLRSFETDENYLFFGRDGQSDEVLTKLRTARFVAVVGTSGSGKSSLVRAGLLPALFSGHMTSAGSSWRIATFRPGSSPISNLAKALSESEVGATSDKESASVRLTNVERTLRRSSLGLLEVVSQSRMAPHENLLILADQFEELFRFRKKSSDEHPEDEAAAFVKLLLEAKQPDKSPAVKLPIYVILTMRSDYLGDCAHFWGLPEAINEGQYLIPRMTDDNRREAISGPIVINGGEITAPLVNRLLNDAGDDPAQLPILQHALMRTWDYWKKRERPSEPIDLTHYEEIGGMALALSKHADEAFMELAPELQKVAEKLFKSLTEKEADNREGRRPATVGEICAAAEASTAQVGAVIESFRREGRSFLMPPPTVPLTPDTLIDISHESLIRGWQRLRVWVDQEAQAARQYIRLADTAALFPAEVDYLRDPALQLALNWRETHKPTKPWALRYHPGFDAAIAYLNASKTNREAEIAERERAHKEKVEQNLRHAEAIATEQRRRVKQLRWGLLLLSLLLIGMFAATVVAFQQKRNALQQKSEANNQRDRAENALKAVEVQRNNAERSQKEADAARKVAEDALGTAKQQRDRALIAETETARQRDAAQRERLRAEEQSKVAQQATIKAENQKRIADTNYLTAKLERDKSLAAQALAVKASKEAEEQRNKAVGLLKTVNEIDSSAPYFRAIMRDPEKPIYNTWFTGASDIVTQGGDGSMQMWDYLVGLTDLARQPYLADRVTTPVFYSRSGKLALLTHYSNYSGTVIWDVEAGKELARTAWTNVNPSNTIISPDDRVILRSNGPSARMSLFDARTGQESRKLANEISGNFGAAAFSPYSDLLAISNGSYAEIWNVATGQLVTRLNGHLNEITSAAFGTEILVVTASKDGTAQVWNARTGEALAKLSGHEGAVNSAVFSYDNRYIVTTSKNRAYLWQAKSGQTWKELSDDSPTILQGHTDEVTNAIFSHNGWVVTISNDRTAQLWDRRVLPATHDLGTTKPALANSVAVFRGHIKSLTSVDFRSDSKYLLTGSEDRTARVWDVTGLGTFQVTPVGLTVTPAEYQGKCPGTIKFTGTISVLGRSGKVKFKFVRSDGSQSLPQELVFDGPGTKQVSETRDVFGAANRAGAAQGFEVIEILEPSPASSNLANFTVRCTDAEQLVAKELTPAQLQQIMPGSTDEHRAPYLYYLQKAMDEFGINTPLRQAAFLAAVAVNTVDLRIMEELGPDERFEKLYGSRKDLGNFQPGDGARYKGRGAFMLTGRSYYQAFGQQFGVDLVAYPERAAAPDLAFRTAAFYWQKNGLNELADKSDLTNIAKRVPAKLVQLQTYFERAKIALGVIPPP